MKCSGLLKLSIRFVSNSTRILNVFLPPIQIQSHFRQTLKILKTCFLPFSPALALAWAERSILPIGPGWTVLTNAAVGLQELQPVYYVLSPDRQVFIPTAALFHHTCLSDNTVLTRCPLELPANSQKDSIFFLPIRVPLGGWLIEALVIFKKVHKPVLPRVRPNVLLGSHLPGLVRFPPIWPPMPRALSLSSDWLPAKVGQMT